MHQDLSMAMSALWDNMVGFRLRWTRRELDKLMFASGALTIAPIRQSIQITILPYLLLTRMHMPAIQFM